MRRIAVGALLVLVLGAGACTRKTTLMQDSESPETAAPPDTQIARLREAQQVWESEGDDARAASLTARALYEDLRAREPREWRSRAEDLLDSLGVGVETTGGPCAMMVNMFVRSDPSRGSWPAFFWCDRKHPRWQEMEGRGMRLVAMATKTQPGDTAAVPPPTRVAALFARVKAGRSEPFLYTWNRKPKDTRWKIAQTLGADSLGGFGSAALETPSDTTVELVATTFRTPRGWEECSTCPHVQREHRFRWGAEEFERVANREIATTYSAFVHFVEELMRGAPEAANRVTDPALVEVAKGFEWDRSKGTWRLAPAAEEARSEMTFFRGRQEAYRVTFVPEGEEWRIASIQSVSRAVE